MDCIDCQVSKLGRRVFESGHPRYHHASKCPAWALVDPDGAEVVAARPWAKWVVMLPTTWRHTNGGIVKLDAARAGPTACRPCEVPA
eukprot:826249-Heterocapsa_arctica.AAC.1